YLTVAQFAARYGASKSAVAQVTAYLKGQGLSVGQVAANHLSVSASGTAKQLEKAFGVSLSTYHDAKAKRDFFANSTDPRLPAGIAASVADVAGLNNFAQHAHFAQKAATPAATSRATIS